MEELKRIKQKSVDAWYLKCLRKYGYIGEDKSDQIAAFVAVNKIDLDLDVTVEGEKLKEIYILSKNNKNRKVLVVTTHALKSSAVVEVQYEQI